MEIVIHKEKNQRKRKEEKTVTEDKVDLKRKNRSDKTRASWLRYWSHFHES